MQYQFELLSMKGKYSNLLSQVRKTIEQVHLSNEEYIQVEKYISRLNQVQLHLLFAAIELLLCFIPNSNYSNQITIEQLGNSVQKSHLFHEISSGSFEDIFQVIRITIDKIIHVYELVEKDLFIFVVDFIRPDYKETCVDDATVEELKKFIEKLQWSRKSGLPSHEQISNAL